MDCFFLYVPIVGHTTVYNKISGEKRGAKITFYCIILVEKNSVLGYNVMEPITLVQSSIIVGVMP